jgi:predicted MPP superfamily phosphohydrolase
MALRIALATLSTLVAIVLAAGVYGFFIEPNRLVLRPADLALPGWPATFPPLKVAVIADLHAGAPFIGIDKVRRVVAMANGAKPDMILLPGDFIINGIPGGHFIEPAEIASELSHLSARYGVYATLGDHDAVHDHDKVLRAFQEASVSALDNYALKVDLGGNRAIWLAGLADDFRGDVAKTFRHVTDDAPVIAVTHNPDLFPEIPARVVLTIAGHTHGGQVALPLIGRPIVPSRFGQRYAIGHIVENGRHLFVSPGIGTSRIPVRFGVLPEISLLTIRSQ